MIRFFAPGTPVPKGSMSAFVVGGRAIVTDQKGARVKRWQAAIKSAAIDAGAQRIDSGPVSVVLVFGVAAPAKIPSDRRGSPSAKPDLDKLVRAALDALTGVCFRDDAQVCGLYASKRYGELGVDVFVGALP